METRQTNQNQLSQDRPRLGRGREAGREGGRVAGEGVREGGRKGGQETGSG